MNLTTGWKLQDAAKVPDSGQVISKIGYSPAGWFNAAVPGTVLTSLVVNGVYPEPLYGENNRPDKIPDTLCRSSYWYRTEFTVPAINQCRRLWLNFDGINYIAEIWVDGQSVGIIRGAFARGKFDITSCVCSSSTAAIAVHILPPPNPGNPAEHTQAHGTGPNGGILAQDGPTFLCSIGWDWIPPIRDRNIGIWQKAWLSQSGPVVVENPMVVTDLPLPRTDTADLTVTASLRNVTDQSATGILCCSIGDVRFQTDVSLRPHETRTVNFNPSDTPQLHFTNPRLWWPNGYGLQNLYTLHLEFETAGAISDSHDVNFGIRQITYYIPGTDNLTISVNGVPIICKGGNWGMDEAMKRIPRSRLEAQIRTHQLANYTMIRNWVGQSTSEDFYDLCDRYGLLVWDEFFQPNPSDGPDPSDTTLYLANVREKILRFRTHPCIALWCARNEGDPPPAIDAGIQSIMNELEPRRLYQKNSADGRGVRSAGPYSWREPQQYYVFPNDEAFKTEIGSVSIPTLEAVQAMMPQKDWDTFNDDWASHDLCRGAQAGDLFPAQIAQRFGPAKGLAAFVREGQLATYEAYRAMYEGRFARLFHPVTGVLTWMSNPAQPSLVWQLYSHDLEPNAALFAVRKACEPIHVQMNQSDFHLMVINATPVPQSGLHVRVRIFNLDSSLASDREMPATAAACAATDLGAMQWPKKLSPVHFVKLELFDAQNHLVSENFYWRSAKEDFTDLQSLPPASVQVTFTRRDDAGKCLLTATATNRGSALALMTHLQLRKSASGERVLPVYYSDNYLSLLPGESRTVEIEAAVSDLGPKNPVIAVDGWNVPSSCSY